MMEDSGDCMQQSSNYYKVNSTFNIFSHENILQRVSTISKLAQIAGGTFVLLCELGNFRIKRRV